MNISRGIGLTMGGLIALCVIVQATATKAPAPAAAASPVDSMGSLAETQQIKLDFDWRRGGFDTVMIATFRISNANPFAIKDIAVVCELAAPSGTTIGRNAITLYQTIPAKGRKTIREVNMGRPLSLDFSQAAGASCEVSKFHRA